MRTPLVALGSTVAVGCFVSALLFARMLAEGRVVGASRPSRWLVHPFTQLAIVCALAFVNQIAFNVYVRAMHRGNPWFVAQYIGAGWFEGVPHHPVVVVLARWLGPHAAWLSPSVLRVQAFLELPFTFFAYLSIARLLDRALYRVLCRPLVLACASVAFTIPFCVAEVLLRNPWTNDDLAVRAVACVIVPVWIAYVSKDERGGAAFPASESRPRGIVGLLTFVAGALATSYLVLVMYDVVFLYNLAHFSPLRGPVVAALSLATLAHVGDGRFDGFAHRVITASHDDAPPAPFGVRVATSSLASFTALFFVPSLALRYAGERPLAQILGASIVLAAFAVGVVLAFREARPSAWEVTASVVAAIVALGVGALAAATDLGGLTYFVDGFPEQLLLRKAGVFLAVAVVVWWAVERILTGGTSRDRVTLRQAR